MADYSLGTAHGEIKIDSDTTGVDQAEQAMGRLNKSAQTTEQAINKTANVTGAAGLAIAGGLGLAVKTASDFDAQLSAIAAVGGKEAVSRMGEIREAALKIGAETSFSASEAASAFEELVKAGIPVEDVLNGAADATVALAAATGVDMPTAAGIASNAMNVFNIKASDMDRVVDTFAQTANASAIDVTDLGMAMSQVGAVAALAGLSLEDTTMAIGQMGDAGIKGSDAGTSLKTMLSNLQPSTKKQAEAMRELGLITEDGTNQFYNADGSLKSLRDIQEILKNSTEGLTDAQKQQALETIFGSDAIRAAAVLAEGGASSYDNFADKMTNAGTAAEQAKIRQDNLKGSVEQLKGAAETLAISVGSALTPMIRGLADALTGVVNWFNQLSPTTQSWIVGILASASALLLLTAGILKTVMMVRSFITTLQTLRILSTATQTGFIRMAATWVAQAGLMVARGIWWAGQMALQAASVIAQWALMAAQAVIHGATVAATWAANAAKTVASWALMAAQSALNAAKVAAAWLITNGVAAASALASLAVAVATTVAGWITMAVTATANALIAAAAWFIALGPIGWAIAALIAVVAFVIIFWDDIVKWFKAGAEKVAEWMKAAWQWVVDIWNQIVDAFKQAGEWIGSVMDSIGKAIQAAWDWIVNLFKAAGQWILSVMQSIWNGIVSAWNAVVGAFQAAGQAILNAVKQAWAWVTSTWNSIIGFIRQIPGWIAGVFASAASWLVNAGRNIIAGLANGIMGAISWVWNGLQNIWNAVTGFFSGAAGWLVSAGKNIVIGLWNGIANLAGWLWDKVVGWAKSIWNGVLDFFGIASPSKLFHWAGEQLAMGMTLGVDDNASDAIDAVYSMAEGMSSALGMTQGGPEAFWDGSGVGAGYVPPSNEVRAYAASQGDAEAGPSTVIETNIYNPVAEKASDSNARRLRTLSAMGAF